MANVDNYEERQQSSLSERHELEIDDETDSPRRLNDSFSPESGIELESHGTDLTAKGEDHSRVSPTDENTDSTNEVKPNGMFQFDLTNPDEVMHMLETVDLTDEDTDVLLQEAYNVNRKLRMMLQKKELEQEFNSAENAIVHGSSVIMVPGSTTQSRANSNTRAPSSKPRSGIASRESLFAKNAPLPPINKDSNPNSLHSSSGISVDKRVPSGIYSAKQRRPAPPSASTMPTRNALSSTGPAQRVVPRQGLMPNKKPKKSESVPIGERPPWNDRFSQE